MSLRALSLLHCYLLCLMACCVGEELHRHRHTHRLPNTCVSLFSAQKAQSLISLQSIVVVKRRVSCLHACVCMFPDLRIFSLPPHQNMLHQLYTKGPFTVGIFRKSANARLCREVAARLEADPDYCLDEVPIAVVGSVFKDFLRSLPNCLLDSRLLNKWIEAVTRTDVTDDEQRESVEKLLKKIPAENLLLLKHVLCLLWHISQHSSVNKMCPSNLAVCIGPSLLSSSKIISPVRREVSFPFSLFSRLS